MRGCVIFIIYFSSASFSESLDSIVLLSIYTYLNEVLRILYFLEQNYRLHMPWDNSVNKKAVIYAVVTTIDVENMPLTCWVRALGSIALTRQTGICHSNSF